MFFLGLEVGKQEVKAIVCNEKGKVVTQSSRPLVSNGEDELPEGWKEQDPLSWWEGVSACLQEIINYLKEAGDSPEDIKAIAVTSASGTIVPLSLDNLPLRKAIMGEDNRAAEETRLVNETAGQLISRLGLAFKPSFSLPKILWIKINDPQNYKLTKKFLHAADFIVGKLTGNYAVTDSSQALKTGYNLVDKRWPGFIARSLGISSQLLPEVMLPGTLIGPISKPCSRETGLSTRTIVTAGATNGVTSLISTGAVSPGEWISAMGKTLGIRGVSDKLIKDKEGRIYCHLHPQGFWLPGGTSSVGLECIGDRFREDNLEELDKKVAERTPTDLTVYPLLGKGENFPFVNSETEGFIIGRPKDKGELYAAYLEGIGLVEKACYDLMEKLGAPVGEKIYSAGEGSVSKEWLQVRSNILNKVLLKPKLVEPAFGAAILAASQNFYTNLTEAAKNMVEIEMQIEPQPDKVKFYTAKYRKFREACRVVGYE